MLAVSTPKGDGNAAFLIDYGLESDLYWVVLQDSGEIWTWRNKDVNTPSAKAEGFSRLRGLRW